MGLQGFAQPLDLLGCLGVCLGRGVSTALLHLLAELFRSLFGGGKLLVQLFPLISGLAIGVNLADGVQVLLQALKIALPTVLGCYFINVFASLGRHLLYYFFVVFFVPVCGCLDCQLELGKIFKRKNVPDAHQHQGKSGFSDGLPSVCVCSCFNRSWLTLCSAATLASIRLFIVAAKKGFTMPTSS